LSARAAGLVLGALLAACAPPSAAPGVPDAAQRRIELSGPAARSEAEISGMAWRGDELWLLPQCPGALSSPVPCAAYVLPEADVRGYLSAPGALPLSPAEVPIDASALGAPVSGSQGFEALAFAGDRAYLTVEAREGARMRGYLASGRVEGEPRRLVLDALVPVPLPEEAECGGPTSWGCNKSVEALAVAGERVLVFFEVNGVRRLSAPLARVFDPALRPLGVVSMDPLDYRLTDATPPDSAGRFWVTNYHFPSDGLCPDDAGRCGGVVERLVELRVTPSGVRRTGAPPLALLGVHPEVGRNWEGIVRLGSEGFLLVTDAFPRPTTILCFVPLRGASTDGCR